MRQTPSDRKVYEELLTAESPSSLGTPGPRGSTESWDSLEWGVGHSSGIPPVSASWEEVGCFLQVSYGPSSLGPPTRDFHTLCLMHVYKEAPSNGDWRAATCSLSPVLWGGETGWRLRAIPSGPRVHHSGRCKEAVSVETQKGGVCRASGLENFSNSRRTGFLRLGSSQIPPGCLSICLFISALYHVLNW